MLKRAYATMRPLYFIGTSTRISILPRCFSSFMLPMEKKVVMGSKVHFSKGSTHSKTIGVAGMIFGQNIDELEANDDAKKANPLSPVEQALQWRPPPAKCQVTPQDLILYALSIGVSTADPNSLRFIYEADADFGALPTFGVILAQEAFRKSGFTTGGMPGFKINLTRLLHGEQYVEIHKEIPTSGTLEACLTIVDILDKGSGAVIIADIDVTDSAGDKVVSSQWSFFFVGAGNFGGKRTSDRTIIQPMEAPKRQPDCYLQFKTTIDQAALYRLTGDSNPLHIDPSFAAKGGFDKPILHGLASYGITGRLVLQQYAGNNPALFKSMKARFSSTVLPGETLKVDMWREGNRIQCETIVVETGKTVLSGAYVDLKSVVTE